MGRDHSVDSHDDGGRGKGRRIMANDIKGELAKRASGSEAQAVKLAKLTPECFPRIALSVIKNTPKLAECSPMSFIAALIKQLY